MNDPKMRIARYPIVDNYDETQESSPAHHIRDYPDVQTAPLLMVFPGAAITLSVLSANLLGGALRDLLDPRYRGRM